MKSIIGKTILTILAAGMSVLFTYGQSPLTGAIEGTVSGSERAMQTATVYAVTANRSRRNALIWVDGQAPVSMRDVLKYHISPGTGGVLKVTIPASGKIRFVAGDGSATSTGQYNKVLASCTWTGNPRTPHNVPNLVWNGSSLSCGTVYR